MSALDGWMDVLRTGTWEGVEGRRITVTGEDLDRIVERAQTADPVPVVLGHPAMDDPAQAWVEAVRRTGDRLQVRLGRIAEDFRTSVEAGRYAARSVRLLPHSAGGWVLRHVGFLGARDAAVPGLAPTSFAAGADGSVDVCLAEGDGWLWESLAAVLRAIREVMIDRWDTETADRAIGTWVIEDMLARARTEVEAGSMADAGQGTDIEDIEDKEGGMPPDGQAGADPAELERRAADLDERERRAAEREASLAEQERTRAMAARVDRLVAQGRVLPAEQERVVALAAALPDAVEVTLAAPGEDSPRKHKLSDALLDFLGALPPRVDYAERSGGPPPGAAKLTAAEAAGRAQAWQAAQGRRGLMISLADAVADVYAGRDIEE